MAKSSAGALDQSPRFTADGAARIAREHFGAAGHARPLTSERDQNFLIGGDSSIVLKIANAAEDRAMLEAQRAALRHLEPAGLPVPRIVGDLVDTSESGRSHAVWAITVLDGKPFADVKRRSPALLADLGRQVALLGEALATFDHPAIHRDFYWDLANARSIVGTHLELLDGELASVVRKLAEQFDRHTAPHLDKLPRAAIHGDLNDYNVLVGGGDDLESRGQRAPAKRKRA